MAPVARTQEIQRKNTVLKKIKGRNFQNWNLISTKFYISKIFHRISNIKTKISILKDAFVGNWNIFTDIAIQCNRQECDNGVDDDSFLDKIRNKLAEHCSSSSLTNINKANPNSHIETDELYSARYYASYLWSWSKNTKTTSSKVDYIRRFVQMTLEKMNNQDMDFILSTIINRYNKYFSAIDCNTEKADLIQEILSKLQGFRRYTAIIIEILHIWFMAMPLLKQLSYYVEWEQLKSLNAFLLDEDRLYSLVVMLTYV